MKKQGRRWSVLLSFWVLFLCLGISAAPAGAEEMLQNTGFESYDANTLVPDNWTLIDGGVAITGSYVYADSASVYSLGGNCRGSG